MICRTSRTFTGSHQLNKDHRMRSTFITLIIFYGFYRLVYSVQNNLGLYVVQEPVSIFKGIIHSRVTFSFYIPNFLTNKRVVSLMSEGDELIQGLNVTVLHDIERPPTNLISIYKYLVDIKKYLFYSQTKITRNVNI